MIRNLSIFLGTFVAGSVIALVARAALFTTPTGPESTAAVGGGDYAAMVSNPLAPASLSSATDVDRKTSPSANPPHDSHAAHPADAPSAADAGKPVNTVCAICGMPVDPSLPTAEYQGKTIGFGCKLCPAKFKADPERYGPLYLKNEVVKR